MPGAHWAAASQGIEGARPAMPTPTIPQGGGGGAPVTVDTPDGGVVPVCAAKSPPQGDTPAFAPTRASGDVANEGPGMGGGGGGGEADGKTVGTAEKPAGVVVVAAAAAPAAPAGVAVLVGAAALAAA
eukprot:CAMPEP_0170390902 /NCGR_PEP_ID=MMETSP0117_2-20130122/19392_1 /TAXON_ID=400756 /ORGANISM="Durinskia baltica, Strain CSIRO CS-38" /LENGTH=127 /DNA_ID=CAMNT_0010646975 /DNA_START=98 /DNA_END=479 /DNA_ORIENTATION=-